MKRTQRLYGHREVVYVARFQRALLHPQFGTNLLQHVCFSTFVCAVCKRLSAESFFVYLFIPLKRGFTPTWWSDCLLGMFTTTEWVLKCLIVSGKEDCRTAHQYRGRLVYTMIYSFKSRGIHVRLVAWRALSRTKIAARKTLFDEWHVPMSFSYCDYAV